MEMLLSSIVNTHMPTKKMWVRTQDVPYMIKEWKDAIRAVLINFILIVT